MVGARAEVAHPLCLWQDSKKDHTVTCWTPSCIPGAPSRRKEAQQEGNKWAVACISNYLDNFLSASKLSVPAPSVRLSQAIVCLFCPHLLKKHSQHSSLLNYCNSSIKMEIPSSAHVDLKKAWPFKGGSQVPDLSHTHLMNSLEALGVFRVIDSMLIRETMFNVLNEAMCLFDTILILLCNWVVTTLLVISRATRLGWTSNKQARLLILIWSTTGDNTLGFLVIILRDSLDGQKRWWYWNYREHHTCNTQQSKDVI